MYEKRTATHSGKEKGGQSTGKKFNEGERGSGTLSLLTTGAHLVLGHLVGLVLTAVGALAEGVALARDVHLYQQSLKHI